MKRIKKLVGLVLAMIMVIAMAIPVMAEETVSLEVKHIANNHTFKAYQIFGGNLNNEGVMSNIVWGSGVSNETQLINYLKNDETRIFNSDGTQSVIIKEQFASVNNATDVAEVITKWSNNGERLDYLAEIIGNSFLNGSNGVASDTIHENSDGTFTYTINNLNPGYYLIKDETVGVNGNDFSTKYLVNITTSTVINTKGHFSTVELLVGSTLDGTYGKYISEQVKKEFFYKYEVKLDDNLKWYKTYNLTFNGELDPGIEIIELKEIYVEETGGNKEYFYQNGAWVSDDKKANSISTGTNSLVLGWDNLRRAYSDIAGDDKLVVKFSAQLNENASFGKNSNDASVNITYSNSPSNSGAGTSITDKAYVFSYQANINKVCADDNSKELAGAEFKLYHLHGSDKVYAVTNEQGVIISWTGDKDIATTFITNSYGKFEKNIKGFKEGTKYYLNETVSPSGYNLLFTDSTMIIHPTYNIDSNGNVGYSVLAYNVDGATGTVPSGADFDNGLIRVTVLNDKGTTLPSTGGIGTTIFYIAGGALALAAVVLLVTRKRMER